MYDDVDVAVGVRHSLNEAVKQYTEIHFNKVDSAIIRNMPEEMLRDTIAKLELELVRRAHG